MYNQASTIAAISTPPGTGGIGVIKISGPLAFSMAEKFFRFKKSINTPKPYQAFIPGKIYVGQIISQKTGNIIDEALIFCMKGPRSYTGEDLVEIQTHSGQVILHTLLEEIYALGIEPAQPGEFTKRAYLNGRMDLTQAESVIDLIHSKNQAAAQVAINQVTGYASIQYQALSDKLIRLLSLMEAEIDFSEDIQDQTNSELILSLVKDDILPPITDLLTTYAMHHHLRDGVNVVIAGTPNVGKSSLMNCLLDKDKSIVTDIPGTTRDIVDDTFFLNGHPILISDTAGLQDTIDPVETIGINRAKEHIQRADIVLFVMDISQRITTAQIQLYQELDPANTILVLNKEDLISSDVQPELSFADPDTPRMIISAKYRTGISSLLKAITLILNKHQLDTTNVFVPTLRQKAILEQIIDKLHLIVDTIIQTGYLELAVIDVKDCINLFHEIN